MRNPHRIPVILNLLKEVWEQNPDLRLSQLILNAAYRGGWEVNDAFYAEEATIIAGLTLMLKEGER